MNWKNIFKNIGGFFCPGARIEKNHMLIAQYWREDCDRRIQEARFVMATNPAAENEKLKKELDKIGATDVLMCTEGLEGPKLSFKLNGKQIISDEIFDFTCEKIMENINLKINDSRKII